MSVENLFVLVVIIIILALAIRQADLLACVGVAFGILVVMLGKRRRRKCKNSSGGVDRPKDISASEGLDAQANDVKSADAQDVKQPSSCEERRPTAQKLPTPGAREEELIAQSHLFSLNQIYGRRSAGSIDNALYAHKQRIGDRDRQATINQVRGRRTNVYEPYYRQELSEHASKRWWEPDDVLVTKLEKRQLETIPMGRHILPNEDLDGIYSVADTETSSWGYS
jgi:hypothetical protein